MSRTSLLSILYLTYQPPLFPIPHSTSSLKTVTLQQVTITAKYRLNKTGAMVHPCLNPFLKVISSMVPPLTLTTAIISSWHNLISDTITGGTPYLFNTCHKISLDTESYALMRSTNNGNRDSSCSLLFSSNCLAGKIISTHSLPLWKPH